MNENTSILDNESDSKDFLGYVEEVVGFEIDIYDICAKVDEVGTNLYVIRN